MPTNRERWFAEVLHAGLETKILTEQDILSHITPAILAAALPRDVLVRVFDAALSSGTISPKAVVETATAELMAERVPAGVVWGCIAAAAVRAGIPEEKPKDDTGAREFLRRMLAAALNTGVLAPKDVVVHVNAQVLGHFPDELATKLLEVSLAAGKLNPEMIMETLGVDAIARHAPTAVVWASFVKAGEAPATTAVIAGEREAPRAAISLEFVDDDVSSIMVDLEDSTELSGKEALAQVAVDKTTKKSAAATARTK